MERNGEQLKLRFMYMHAHACAVCGDPPPAQLVETDTLEGDVDYGFLAERRQCRCGPPPSMWRLALGGPDPLPQHMAFGLGGSGCRFEAACR